MKALELNLSSLLIPTCVFFALIFYSACNPAETDKARRKAETDLVEICEPLNIPGASKLKDDPINRGINKIVVWKKFRSDISCDAISEHFHNYFVGLSWDPNRMDSRHSGGGLEVMDFRFRHDDYVVAVECESGKASDEFKSVVVSCSWGLLG